MSRVGFKYQQQFNETHPFRLGREDPLLYKIGVWVIGICCGLLALLIVAEVALLVYSLCH